MNNIHLLLLIVLFFTTGFDVAPEVGSPASLEPMSSPPPPPPTWKPSWGMWGVNVAKDDPDSLRTMISGGIRYISLAGWLADTGYASSDVNWRVSLAKSWGASRVVVPITHTRIKLAQATGDLSKYIYSFMDGITTTNFFCVDEPRYQREPSRIIKAIADRIKSTRKQPRGLYIADPVTDQKHDSSYYSPAYRMMPDYYAKPLTWKKTTYVKLRAAGLVLAPLIPLMYVAGQSGPSIPTYNDLRREIDNSKTYCSEIWFYVRRSDDPKDPSYPEPRPDYDLFNPTRAYWSTLSSVIASYK